MHSKTGAAGLVGAVTIDASATAGVTVEFDAGAELFGLKFVGSDGADAIGAFTFFLDGVDAERRRRGRRRRRADHARPLPGGRDGATGAGNVRLGGVRPALPATAAVGSVRTPGDLAPVPVGPGGAIDFGKFRRVKAGGVMTVEGAAKTTFRDKIGGKTKSMTLRPGNGSKVGGLEIAGNLTLLGTPAGDRATVRDLEAGGPLKIDRGDGDDRLRLLAGRVGGHLSLRSGPAENDRAKGTRFVWNGDVGGGVSVKTGAGRDSVKVGGGAVGGKVAVDGGRDAVRLRAMGAGAVNVKTGDGADRVALRKLGVKGSTRIDAGAGDDKVVAGGAEFGRRVKVLGGAGADRLDLDGGAAATPRVRLRGGAGRDVLGVPEPDGVKPRSFEPVRETR